MARLLASRLLWSVPLLWGVVTLLFLLLEASPGDFADAFVAEGTDPRQRAAITALWGLDAPAHVRYLRLLANLATGDLGLSVARQRPVAGLIAEALPNTLLLGSAALAVTFVGGAAIGAVQAARRGRPADHLLSGVTLLFASIPSFWLALVLVLVFVQGMGMLPASGTSDPIAAGSLSWVGRTVDRLEHLVLPVAALSLASLAGTARHMRSALLEVIHQDYILVARAKGLPESAVLGRHALRNALLPLVTILGSSVPSLFGGAVVIEIIFAWPGVGRLVYEAIRLQDVPLLAGCTVVFGAVVIGGNLLADLACAALDPRIRRAA